MGILGLARRLGSGLTSTHNSILQSGHARKGGRHIWQAASESFNARFLKTRWVMDKEGQSKLSFDPALLLPGLSQSTTTLRRLVTQHSVTLLEILPWPARGNEAGTH
jgi:hypothetical protein